LRNNLKFKRKLKKKLNLSLEKIFLKTKKN